MRRRIARPLLTHHNAFIHSTILFFIAIVILSSGLSSKRIILSPFTKEFRGEGHSYEYLIFSEAPHGAVNPKHLKFHRQYACSSVVAITRSLQISLIVISTRKSMNTTSSCAKSPFMRQISTLNYQVESAWLTGHKGTKWIRFKMKMFHSDIVQFTHDHFVNLRRLSTLNISFNQLRKLPELPPQLKLLDISFNKIDNLTVSRFLMNLINIFSSKNRSNISNRWKLQTIFSIVFLKI